MRTYSLTEVAHLLCGDDMKLPLLWVKRRIWDGTFRAVRVGRSYRMTEAQLEAAIKALESGPLPDDTMRGLTPASLRRRSA